MTKSSVKERVLTKIKEFFRIKNLLRLLKALLLFIIQSIFSAIIAIGVSLVFDNYIPGRPVSTFIAAVYKNISNDYSYHYNYNFPGVQSNPNSSISHSRQEIVPPSSSTAPEAPSDTDRDTDNDTGDSSPEPPPPPSSVEDRADVFEAGSFESKDKEERVTDYSGGRTDDPGEGDYQLSEPVMSDYPDLEPGPSPEPSTGAGDYQPSEPSGGDYSEGSTGGGDYQPSDPVMSDYPEPDLGSPPETTPSAVGDDTADGDLPEPPPDN